MQIRSTILIGSLFAGSALAATVQVTTQSGLNTCAATAGNVCVVHGVASGGLASYSVPGTIASGSAGNPTTLIVNGTNQSSVTRGPVGGDSVTLTGAIGLGSHNYISIIGFTLTGAINANNGSHITADHNSWSGLHEVFRCADETGMCSYSIITNNLISRPNAHVCGAGLYVYGDHTVIDNNDMSGGASDFLEGGGLNVVVRNNDFHDIDGFGSSGGCEHIDFVQQMGGGVTPTLTYSLIEGNHEENCYNDAGNCHALILRSTSPTTDHTIYRFNYHHGLDGGGITNGGGSTDVATNTAIYNNTIATESLNSENGDFVSCWSGSGGTNGVVVANNISYHTGSASYSPYSCDTGTNGAVLIGGNFSDGGTAYCAAGSYTCATGSPGFANYPTNGTLTSGSQLRGFGVPLALTVGSGSSSTSITLNHANVFQPGWSGVQGDCIRVGDSTASPTTCITAVNYSTNVLTVSPAISWSNNAGVYLWKKSDGAVVFNVATATRPDTGAYPYGITGGGTAPTITTTSLPNGTVGVGYSQTLTATGDTPITWDEAVPGLSACGLTLSSAGSITGTPSSAQTCNFSARATNAAGSNTKALSIQIVTAGDPHGTRVTGAAKKL